MPNQECKICYGIIKCVSAEGSPRKLQYIPEEPFVIPREGSVDNCEIRRDPENHQKEINRRKLPDFS